MHVPPKMYALTELSTTELKLSRSVASVDLHANPTSKAASESNNFVTTGSAAIWVTFYHGGLRKKTIKNKTPESKQNYLKISRT